MSGSHSAEAIERYAAKPAPPPPGATRARQIHEPQLEPPPPPPGLPTETDRRAALVQALEDQRGGAEKLSAAMQNFERAQRHVGNINAKLLDHVDVEAARFTEQAIRNGEAVIELPAAIRDGQAERDRLKADTVRAETVLNVLTGELADARAKAAEAAKRVDTAALQVIVHLADAVVRRHNAAQAEVEACFRLLAGLDRVTTGSGVALPSMVLSILRSEPIDRRGLLASPLVDTAPWKAAKTTLLADPMAAVVVAEE